MKFDVCIKSGTCGYSDYDQCDMVIQESIITEQLPNKGDNLILYTEDDGHTEYLVTDICRSFIRDEEYNTVYVIKV